MVGIVQVELELTGNEDRPLAQTSDRNQSTNLIDGWNDGGIWQNLFLQLLPGEVGDTNAFDFPGLEQVFHLLPGVSEFPVEQDVTAGTIWEGGEIWMIPVWVEGDLGGRNTAKY